MQATKSVKNPRKQRQRMFNAPAHLRHKMMSAHLAPDLMRSQGARSLPVRKGDTVRIMRGDHQGFEGKISRVDLANYRIYLEGLTREKVDGTVIFIAVHPSKVLVKSLNLDDKWLKRTTQRKQPLEKQEEAPAPPKPAKEAAKPTKEKAKLEKKKVKPTKPKAEAKPKHAAKAKAEKPIEAKIAPVASESEAPLEVKPAETKAEAPEEAKVTEKPKAPEKKPAAKKPRAPKKTAAKAEAKVTEEKPARAAKPARKPGAVKAAKETVTAEEKPAETKEAPIKPARKAPAKKAPAKNKPKAAEETGGA
jgi:large subunit ribosomal protein L24